MRRNIALILLAIFMLTLVGSSSYAYFSTAQSGTSSSTHSVVLKSTTGGSINTLTTDDSTIKVTQPGSSFWDDTSSSINLIAENATLELELVRPPDVTSLSCKYNVTWTWNSTTGAIPSAIVLGNTTLAISREIWKDGTKTSTNGSFFLGSLPSANGNLVTDASIGVDSGVGKTVHKFNMGLTLDPANAQNATVDGQTNTYYKGYIRIANLRCT